MSHNNQCCLLAISMWFSQPVKKKSSPREYLLLLLQLKLDDDCIPAFFFTFGLILYANVFFKNKDFIRIFFIRLKWRLRMFFFQNEKIVSIFGNWLPPPPPQIAHNKRHHHYHHHQQHRRYYHWIFVPAFVDCRPSRWWWWKL